VGTAGSVRAEEPTMPPAQLAEAFFINRDA
jgi:hypothetical protein